MHKGAQIVGTQEHILQASTSVTAVHFTVPCTYAPCSATRLAAFGCEASLVRRCSRKFHLYADLHVLANAFQMLLLGAFHIKSCKAQLHVIV